MTYQYQLIFLGDVGNAACEAIKRRFFEIIHEMGLQEDAFIKVTAANFATAYQNKQPTFAYYFGKQNHNDQDADKLDIFYEGAEMFWTKKEEVEEINNSKITDNVFNDFYNNSLINRKEIETKADGIVSFIGFIFDINYKYDFVVLRNEDYINKILDKFRFYDEKTAEQMRKIRIIAKGYIDKQL